MMSLLTDLAASTLVVVLGASAAVTIWHGAVLALLVTAWRLRRRRPARQEHAAALATLAVAVLLALATPFVLLLIADAPAVPAVETDQIAPPAVAATPAVIAPPTLQITPAARLGLDPRAGLVLGWIGLACLAGALFCLVRLAGGWAAAQWVRTHATPLPAGEAADVASGVMDRWRVHAGLYVSDHVEAPVVLGARQPAILLPRRAAALRREAILPLIAHELAHVQRGDYTVNLIQAACEALLFFSPGIRSISRTVRHAREYCCDDLVIERQGERRAYADALTELAGLGAVTRKGFALGAGGPRLISRIRRILQEDTMASFNGLRVAVAVAASLLVAGPGALVVAVSANAVGAARAQGADASYTFAYPTSQAGTGLELLDLTPSPDAICGSALLVNDNAEAVSAMQFVAVVAVPGERPVSIAEGEWLDVAVPAKGSGRVVIGLMPAADAARRQPGARPQVHCALRAVRFANGAMWTMTPNPAATDGETALGLARQQISRARMDASVAEPSPDGLCRGDASEVYSEGALVPISREPGRLALCSSGSWKDDLSARR